MAAQPISQAQRNSAFLITVTGGLGILGSFACNPMAAAAKKTLKLALGFGAASIVEKKLSDKKYTFSYATFQFASTIYFTYSLVQGLKEDPWNPQNLCDLSAAMLNTACLICSTATKR